MDEKTSIIKKLSQLKNDLYGDDKDNMDEQERIEKTKLLHDYELILEEINKENQVSIGKKQAIKVRRKQLSKTFLNNNKDVEVSGIYSFIQESDEQFYDAIVFYKGYSTEYNTEFLVYNKEETQETKIVALINIYGYLIAQPINDKEMIDSLTVQYLNEMGKFKDFTTVPYIIGCIENMPPKNVNIIDNKQAKQLEDKQTVEISDNQVQINNTKMYYYKAKLPWYNKDNCTRNLFKYLKETPELFINVNYLYNINAPAEIVLSFSIPMEQLEFDKKYWTKDKDEWLNFLSQYIGQQVDENYLNTKFNPHFTIKNFNTKEKLMFIYDLNQSNPNAYIKEVDEDEKCRVKCKLPFAELKTDKTWLFFIDKDGYIVRSSQKLSKYSFNFFQRDFQEIDSIDLEQTNIDDDPFFNATEIPNYIDECIVNSKNNIEKGTSPIANESSNHLTEEQKQIRVLLDLKENLMRQNSLLAKQNQMLLDEINLMKKQMQSTNEQQNYTK